MLKLEQMPSVSLEEPALSERLREAVQPRAVKDAGGAVVGVVISPDEYQRFRELSYDRAFDEMPPEALKPAPLDEQGRPIGITFDELLERLAPLLENAGERKRGAA